MSKNGKKIFLPARPNELQFDIDSAAALKVFNKNLAIFKSKNSTYHAAVPWRAWRNAVLSIHKSPSPSGKHGRYHITVTLARPITNLQRVALQACLGSDRVRETLSLCRVLNGSPIPTLFFERKNR